MRAVVASFVAVIVAGFAPAAAAEDTAPTEDFARIEARLCRDFEVCEPPCGTTEGDRTVASSDN